MDPVCIIGAGVSGCTCAKYLSLFRIKSVILEARDRIGGRIWTSDLGESPIDMGGAWVHGAVKENPVFSMLQKLGIDTKHTDYENDWLYDESYEAMSSDEEEELEEAFEDLDSYLKDYRAKERRNLHLQDVSVAEAFDSQIDRWIDEKKKGKKTNKSKRQRLRNRMKFFLQHKICLDYACDLEEMSFNDLSEDEWYGPKDDLVIGGYKQLIDFLAQGIEIKTCAVVKSITRNTPQDASTTSTPSNTDVETNPGSDGQPNDTILNCIAYDQQLLASTPSSSITTTTTTTTTTSFSSATITSPFCVVTVPLGVLKAGDIKFSPPLPNKVIDAMDQIGMACLNKVTLVFDQVFWPSDGSGFQCLKFPKWSVLVYPEYKALQVYQGGDEGRRWESMTDEEIVAEVMDRFRMLWPDSMGNTTESSHDTVETKANNDVPVPLHSHITRWYQDPFARGSYSFSKVGGCRKNYQTLAEPLFFEQKASTPSSLPGAEGGLLFAGEATDSKNNATVHGAFKSGKRAAMQIILAMGKASNQEEVEKRFEEFEDGIVPI